MPLEDALLAFIREKTGAEVAWPDEALEDRSINPLALREGSAFLGIRNHIVIARNTPAVVSSVKQLLDEVRASGEPVAYVEAPLEGAVNPATIPPLLGGW